MKKTIIILAILLAVTALAYPTSSISPVSRQNAQWVVNLAQCSDTDGGKNYFVRGTLASYDPMSGKQIHISDECAMSNGIPVRSCAGSNCGVLETTCGGPTGYFIDSSFLCPNGCKSGACFPFNRKMSNLNACAEICGSAQTTCELSCPSSRYKRTDCLKQCKDTGRTCRTTCPMSTRR